MTHCALFLHGHQPYYNEEFIVKEIIWQSYGPLFKMLTDLSDEYKFKLNLSLTGSVLQWFERLQNDFLINSLKELISKDRVEILLSPFYHSPIVFTNDGFVKEQFYHHRKMVKDLFGKEMRGIFPPEMIYSTHKNVLLAELDVDYTLIEGVHNAFYSDDVEGIWKLETTKEIYALARNRALSWHFSDNTFPNADWLLNTISKKEGPIAIGCDLECFGHHRGEDSFKFLDYFLKNSESKDVQLLTLNEIIAKNKKKAQLYKVEEITTWARSLNVFFPHSKIIEMWFVKNEVVSKYHQVESLYFNLEMLIQSKEDEKLLQELIDFKINKLDDLRWIIYRELTDAALYHEDFSNENTYRVMLDRCSWIKSQLWEFNNKLNRYFEKV